MLLLSDIKVRLNLTKFEKCADVERSTLLNLNIIRLLRFKKNVIIFNVFCI